MDDSRLSRRAILRIAGGTVVGSFAFGSAGARALGAGALGASASPARGDVGTLMRVSGSSAEALTGDGALHSGHLESVRRLKPGDRVMIDAGSETTVISPLYEAVEGVVTSVDDSAVEIDGATYSIDQQSLTRSLRRGAWVDRGTVGDSVREGQIVQALCVPNAKTESSTVALAFI